MSAREHRRITAVACDKVIMLHALGNNEKPLDEGEGMNEDMVPGISTRIYWKILSLNLKLMDAATGFRRRDRGGPGTPHPDFKIWRSGFMSGAHPEHIFRIVLQFPSSWAAAPRAAQARKRRWDEHVVRLSWALTAAGGRLEARFMLAP